MDNVIQLIPARGRKLARELHTVELALDSTYPREGTETARHRE